MATKPDFLPLSANRVWRSYLGGATLDRLEGKAEPTDSHFPEDWIGSTTQAINPGRPTGTEGVAQVVLDGQTVSLADLVAHDPAHYLGTAHAAAFGAEPRVLVKFLDAAIRLHFQCHPTAAFSLAHLDNSYGKAEGYYILDVRPEISDPVVYLGFQRPPKLAALKTMIEQQDITALETCFDPISVQPGDCLFVPGGRPHAIGAGILMVEIMEPSDWAVRFEFERGGYTLPAEARFMKRDLDFALDVFDLRPWSVEQVRAETFGHPRILRESAEGSEVSLLDERLTDRFRVRRHQFKGTWEIDEETFFIGIVTEGDLSLHTRTSSPTRFNRLDRFFACGNGEKLTLESPEGATVLTCHPPAP